MMRTPTSDVVTTDDYLDMIVTPAITPVHTVDSVTTAAPSIPQHVRDVMARVRMQRHEQTIAPTWCTPTAAPPAAQVGGGPVAEAVARHFAIQAERSEAARVTAQVERDACSATARLLASAGWQVA